MPEDIFKSLIKPANFGFAGFFHLSLHHQNFQKRPNFLWQICGIFNF
jgi:hypothetical protein